MKLKAIYTVPELARLTGWSPRRVARVLQRGGVSFKPGIKPRVVTWAQLERAWPEYADSLQILGG